MMQNGHQTPPWYGFALGVLGGFAVSSLLIGLVLGYSVGGMGGAPRAPSAAQPTVPTPPSAPAAPEANKPVPPVTAKDHVFGNPKAKITIIEYSDYQCPFCKRNHPTVKQVIADYKGDVNWVYRHFPLSFHQYAQKSAEAAECAAELGGNDVFWKFTDAIMTDQNDPSMDALEKAAGVAGINIAKFKACVDSGKHAARVKSDEDGGVDAGVQGTPGNFIINNATKETKELAGAVPASSFKSAIDAMLK
jgi:protein-disulfide isomerase